MATTRESTFDPRDPRARYEQSTRYDDGFGEQPSVSALLGVLAGETAALVRAEVALARKDIQDSASSVRRGALAMGAGAGVLIAGLLALVAAVVLRLALVMPNWRAAAIVGVVIAIAGALMLAIGKHEASAGGKPARTFRSLNAMKAMAQYERDRTTRKWQR